MSPEICYKKSFLRSVIVRVDFPSNIPDLDKQLPAVSKGIMKIFPIAESKKSIARELQISPEDLRQKKTEFTTWQFLGKDREKTLTIIPDAIFVEYTTYGSYQVMKDEFLGALKTFFDTYQITMCSRLGLRYINDISLESGDDPLAWSDYLHEKLLGILAFYPEQQYVARAFHNLEMNFGEFNLRYQFGMHNPDYPAPIKKKSFILDLDAYYQGPQDIAEIPDNLDKFHGRIQEIFEASITDQLREVMNA